MYIIRIKDRIKISFCFFYPKINSFIFYVYRAIKASDCRRCDMERRGG
jgi:hypothetical protein